MRIATVLLLLLASAGFAVAETAEADADVTAPYLIPESRVSPSYPPAALAARFDGTVMMALKVLRDGSVESVEVLDSSRPNLGFEQAAESAVNQWRFEPALRNGEPVDAYSVVRLYFRPAQPGSRSSGFVAAGFDGFVPMGSVSRSMVAPITSRVN